MSAPRQAEAIIAALSIRGLLDLVDAVCTSRGVTHYELCGRGRSHAVCAARQELWWLIRNHPSAATAPQRSLASSDAIPTPCSTALPHTSGVALMRPR